MENEYEKLKVTILEKFPDKKEDIDKCETLEALTALQKELTKPAADEPKTSFEIYKEALMTAKTNEEMETAKEDYMRASILDEEKERLLETAVKTEQERVDREINKIPKRMEKIEDSVEEMKTMLTTFVEKTDNRFEKMENAPAVPKGTVGPSGEPILEPPFDAYMKHAGTDAGLKGALRMWKDARRGRDA